MAQLESRKQAWSQERNQLDVTEVIDDVEMEISRQGYVDIAFAPIGNTVGRLKKMWMVASQGSMYLYHTWKDEAPMQRVDLVLCSVRPEGQLFSRCIFFF